jgi:hypothetical protein
MAAKDSGKVLKRAEARKLRDSGRWEVGVEEQLLRALQSQASHVPLEGHVLALDEKLGEVAGSKARDARDFLEAERLGVMLVNVVDRAAQAAILSRGDRPFDRARHILCGAPISRQEIFE